MAKNSNNSNIINVYKFYYSDTEPAYLYSTRNDNPPSSFSYFMLSAKDGIPEITKIHNAIGFLQANNLVLKPIDAESPDYEEFTTLFSQFIRSFRPLQTSSLSLPKKSLTYVYPRKKK